jgi:predicted ATPase/class 3 adenylate cyclase
MSGAKSQTSVHATLPTGTVTFLFTDVEGSTRLLQRLGADYRLVQDAHGLILRKAIAAGGGTEVSTEGDGVFAVFPTPGGAVRSAIEAQRGLASHPWPHGEPLRVRMGLHTGEAALTGGSYLGIDVNRAARISAAAHGGQVLLSSATRGLIESALPSRVTLRDLGEHRLKDLARPEHLHDLVIEGLPSRFPPVRSLSGSGARLPAQLTSFIGREREVRELGDLLGSARLVTLTGPGGTGKTRLALEVARGCSDKYPAGVTFVDLTPLATPDLVPSAIAQAFEVTEDPSRSIVDSIVEHLREQQLLLVLDNFEHVTDAVPAVDAILTSTAMVRVLATSRVPLGVYGENEYEVSPLDLPDRTARADDAEALSRYAAIELFVTRAQAARAGFLLTKKNAPFVADICVRLDGLPLAIELAASWIKLLSPEALLARLDRRLALLTGGAATLPGRQRTLRGAIEWSYDLLDEPQRRLLERLSVFVGGCQLESIDAVCNPADELGIETLDGVASLVNKSLVRAGEAHDSEPRFTLLETIGEFAADRLAARREAELTARRHADHFRTFAREAEPHLVGEDQAQWLERVEREHDNLRAALRWALDAPDPELAAETASRVWRFWQQRGHLSEARRWLTEVLDDGLTVALVRFGALIAAGGIAYWQGDVDATETHYQAALELARAMDDKARQVQTLYNLAYIPGMRNDYEAAKARFEEALALAAEIGDRETEAQAEAGLGWNLMLLGNYDESLRRAGRALAYFREAGNRFEVIDQIATMAQAHRLRGDLADARSEFLEALTLLSQAKDLPMTGRVLFMLAATASAEGRHEQAMRIWGAAETIRESSGGIGPLEGLRVPEAPDLARSAIGDQATDRALAEGRRLGPAAVIARERKVRPTTGGRR